MHVLKNLLFISLVFIFCNVGIALSDGYDIKACYQDADKYKNKYDMSRSGVNQAEVINFICELKTAFTNNDKQTISGMVDYPFCVHVGDTMKKIGTRKEFLENFDNIFNKRVRTVLENFSYESVFSTWQGVSFGRGEIWISQSIGGLIKIQAINNEDWKKRYKKSKECGTGKWEITESQTSKGKDGKEVERLPDNVFSDWIYPIDEKNLPNLIYEHDQNPPDILIDYVEMHKDPPDQETLRSKAEIIKNDKMWLNNKPPVEMFAYMLELIYSGNGDKAFSFFQKAWPPSQLNKQETLHDFCDQLSLSSYWNVVEKLNGNKIDWVKDNLGILNR
jgi:hypothetical protein